MLFRSIATLQDRGIEFISVEWIVFIYLVVALIGELTKQGRSRFLFFMGGLCIGKTGGGKHRQQKCREAKDVFLSHK